MKKAPVSRLSTLVMLAIVIFAVIIPANAQTFSVLYNFGTKPGDPIQDGERPALIAQGRDGNMYSASYGGGAHNAGTIFKVTPTGVLTVLYSFDGINLSEPFSGLILGTDGNFYGTTSAGGASGSYGTVFKVTPSGNLTVLYDFEGSDGSFPQAPPVQGVDGNFYGTTKTGGTGNVGTIYKMTPSGTLTSLHQFATFDGAYPYPNLIQATDGNFYGTTIEGGAGGIGTVFRITPSGVFTLLYSFDNTHGNGPIGGLLQASNGSFYGTTSAGGSGGAGVIFKMTSSGTLTVIHNFSGTDGSYPAATLVQATDGNLYGSASTIFRINPNGNSFLVLYNFTGSDGEPMSPFLQHTNGIVYGDTDTPGGTHADGEFYGFNAGIGTFASLVSTSGKVGKIIEMLGQGFTGTTSVVFNGIAASFSASSDTYLTATVPSGATTGKITVTGSHGTLTSNQEFRVTPVILSFNPSSGSVGTSVVITGTSLTQTTKVTFGGIAATAFTVNSDTQVTATVPTGAKTGKITITTPGGVATSAGIFTVTP